MTKAFHNLLLDLAPVLLQADTHQVLSAQTVPEAFHEPNLELIVESYLEYAAKNPEATHASVALKFGSYKSPYELFHDITVACGAAILKYEVGSDKYCGIDSFFKAATQLLLHEVEKLGLGLQEKKPKKKDGEDTLGIFREDFEKILKTNTAANGEFITHINKYEEPVAPSYHNSYNTHGLTETNTVTQPLFSALTGRSALDPRATVVPDPWLLSKAVGSGINTSLSGTIKAFNNPISKIPLPREANSQIMDGFFHPNWYTIESPKWLQYKQKTLKPPLDSTLVQNCDANELRVYEKKSNVLSIGPSIDSRNTVLGEDLKQAVWYNQVGLKKVADITHGYNGSHPEVEVETDKVTEETKEAEKEKESIEVTDPKTSLGKVKLQNLAHYDPGAITVLEELKRQKSEITKSPLAMQKAVSKLLLKLNKLRQERYLHNATPSEPTDLEKALYRQIAKLLFLLAKSNASEGKQVSLPVSKKVPVLLNDYQGTLPGPISSQPVMAAKSNRLASLRAPHKRRSARFT